MCVCVRAPLWGVSSPLQLRHPDEELPPESTLRGWRTKAKLGQVLLAPGRPCTLTPLEEEVVMSTMRFLRKNGVVVDRELLSQVGRKAMAAARSLPFESMQELPLSWVKSFRRRHRLSRFARSMVTMFSFFFFPCRLKRSTTDRMPTSKEQFEADEAWREAVQDVFANPSQYGIPGPSIPKCLILGMDTQAFHSLLPCWVESNWVQSHFHLLNAMPGLETPLLYAPAVRGTYSEGEERKQIFITAAREKRSVTASPVTMADGQLLMVQVIWKGVSPQCHPRCPFSQDTRIFHDHAPKKVQSTETFGNLLRETNKRLQQIRCQEGLPEDQPSILIMDNAPSHNPSLFKSPEGTLKRFTSLFQVTAHPSMWIITTLPNRSHVMNSGDQFINLGLRRMVRASAKRRIAHHFLEIHEVSSNCFFALLLFSLSFFRVVKHQPFQWGREL